MSWPKALHEGPASDNCAVRPFLISERCVSVYPVQNQIFSSCLLLEDDANLGMTTHSVKVAHRRRFCRTPVVSPMQTQLALQRWQCLGGIEPRIIGAELTSFSRKERRRDVRARRLRESAANRFIASKRRTCRLSGSRSLVSVTNSIT